MIKLILKANDKRFSDGDAGFTLVDLLVGLAMAAVLLSTVVALFSSMGRSYTTQNVAADVQQVARAGMDLMIQEIRMAGLNNESTGAGIVDDFDASSGFHDIHDGNIAPTDGNNIAFTMDLDLDGRIDHCVDDSTADCIEADDNIENELIAYRINGGALEKYRSSSGVWEDLTEDNVSALSFTYFDVDGTETNDVNEIRAVEILMTVEHPAGRDRMVSRTYRTRVRCRNIGL
jgi:type II secretory pathway component PulJ